MINCMRVWNYLQVTLGSPFSTKAMKQTHKIMMEDEKVLVGEYRKSPAFAGFYIFAPADHTERYIEDAIFSFYETK